MKSQDTEWRVNIAYTFATAFRPVDDLVGTRTNFILKLNK